MLKIIVDGDGIDITVGGGIDEILAEWAASAVRIEEHLREKGVNDPEELLRVSLRYAELKRERNSLWTN